MKVKIAALVATLAIAASAQAQQHKTEWWELQGERNPAKLIKGAKSPDERMRLVVANNPDAPGEAIILLASDNSEHVRVEVADRPWGIPPQAQWKLAEDRSLRVIQRLAFEATDDRAQRLLLERSIAMNDTAKTYDEKHDAMELMRALTVNQRMSFYVLNRIANLPLPEMAAKARARMEARGMVAVQ